MSKKILSLALAVVMLVSVFAFTASATTFPADGQGGYRVVTDAYVGMPAGETVTLKVYYVLPDSTDYDTYAQSFTGNVILAFTDAFSYNNDRTWGDSYWYMKEGANVNTGTAYKASSAQFNDADTAMGWTDAILVQKTLDTSCGSGLTSQSGHPVDPYCELFTVTFTTTRELKATDTIGIPSGCASKMVVFQSKKPSATTLTAANIITDEFVEGAATLNISDNTAILLRNNAADANTVDVGFIATFMDASFAAEFAGNGTTCTNLANIGIDVRINGTVQSGVENADLNVIYPIDGGYQFVGAVTGIDADNLDTKIEVRAYMIDSDGTTYYSNWIGCNANLRYDDAVDAGMNAIA